MFEVYECGFAGQWPVSRGRFEAAERAWEELCVLYAFGLRGYVVAPDGVRLGISECPDEVYARFEDAIE